MIQFTVVFQSTDILSIVKRVDTSTEIMGKQCSYEIEWDGERNKDLVIGRIS